MLERARLTPTRAVLPDGHTRSGPGDGCQCVDRTGALEPYWAALARRASSPVDHLWVGDSLTEGEGAGALDRRWVELTLASLRTRFQPAGVPGGVGYRATLYLVTVPGGSPWVHEGSPRTPAVSGIGQRSLVLDRAGQALSLHFAGTGFDLLYTGGPVTGDLILRIDGGVGVTLGTRSADLTQCNVHRVRGLTAGPHAVQVARGSGRVILEGAMVYDGDELTGLRGIEFGHAGWMACDYLQPRSLQALRAAIEAYRPALVTLNLGTNECAEGVPATRFKADLGRLVSELLRCCRTPTSLLLFNPYNGAGRAIEDWRPYNAAVCTVAASSSGPRTPSVGVFDLATLFGDVANDPRRLTYDGTHLGDAGNRMWADALASFLAP